jgi:hypothetical protein
LFGCNFCSSVRALEAFSEGGDVEKAWFRFGLGDEQFLGVASLDLGIWRVFQVSRTTDELLGVEIVKQDSVSGSREERRAGVEAALDRQRKDLEDGSIRYTTM